ncbi:hypothetical protein J437_LFUL013797 [Ladona fulva]|uniref:non-specific serine/threonine protein kinase n=1 Tax=Ladona fulva TaxID=123851 RepID=A0A8K0KIN6_LADFU|nr:hypothetical protein J437_LFUL013797 [Ladona fulva]
METLNPFFPENFHSFDTANQSLNEYHSLKHGLDDSVFSNSNLENSVNKSIAQDESFNYNVDHQEEEEAEEDSALNHSFQQRVVLKVDGKTQSPENESISITDKEILKLEREKAQISHLMNCIPSLNENFTIHQKIGEGTFSSVFLATIKGDGDIKKQFAVKHLVPTCHPNRIEKELRCLMDIGGQDNVVGVDLCLRNGLNVAFVMPFLPHQRFSDYLTLMDVDEIRLYMKNLLVALKRVHSFGVIHRDVKPSNFLYDRVGKR